MSLIQLASLNPPGRTTLMAVIGDVVDLQPIDMRYTYAYAAPTKPGGSTATFTGSRFTPDVGGVYSLTVTVGLDVLTVPLWVFNVAAYGSLAPSSPPAYSDAERRAILLALVNGGITAAQLVAWNAGTSPPLYHAQWGGR